MRNGYSLFIGNLQALCDTSELVLFTYTREQLDSPAIVKNSYSQEVVLPRCGENDAIFGHFGRLDRVTMVDTTNGTGEAFNALKRLPFAIYDEKNDIVESGYAKLNSVDAEGYHVNLYGSLGEFFYHIGFDSVGNKKTLADLLYKTPNNEWRDLYGIPEPDAAMVAGCWRVLAGQAYPYEDWETFLNFAPCYNGKPENFEAGKAIATLEQFYGLDAQAGYITNPDASDAVLIDLGTTATEWEVEDLRANLQRPVLKLSAIFDSIEFWSDGKFSVHENVKDRLWFSKGWLTLKQPLRADGSTIADCVPPISPAEFIIAVAKTYGLIFHTDEATRHITLMERDLFYDTDLPLIDLSERIDRDTIEVSPYPVGSAWYVFQHQALGEFAAQHLATTGKTYGAMWLNTGYDFDNAQTDVLAGVPLKGAADVLETSPWFVDYGIPSSGTEAWAYNCLKFAKAGTAKYTLYQQDLSGNLTPKAFDLAFEFYDLSYYNAAHPFADWMPKVQLHDADNKAIDGSGVLLYFDGMVDIPEDPAQGVTHRFHLSEDTDEMLLLTGGKPCWDLRESFGYRSSLPCFRRIYISGGDFVESMDFAESQVIGVPDEDWSAARFTYYARWSKYMADRLDASGKVLTASVNLEGLRVGNELLRRFFWYDGAVWSLNKITNYSLTTAGKTRCEFVKVYKQYNYDNSQL